MVFTHDLFISFLPEIDVSALSWGPLLGELEFFTQHTNFHLITAFWNDTISHNMTPFKVFLQGINILSSVTVLMQLLIYMVRGESIVSLTPS